MIVETSYSWQMSQNVIDTSESVGPYEIAKISPPHAVSCRMKLRSGRDDTIMWTQVTSALQGQMSGGASAIMSFGSRELEIRSVPFVVTPLTIQVVIGDETEIQNAIK